MGTVTKRQTKDGTTRYRAQVRVQRLGYPEFKQSKTFSKKSLADEWIKRTEAAIELNPEKMLNPEVQLKQKTLREFIFQYLEEADSFARTKTGALQHIASLEISEKNIYSLTRQDFSEYAILRRKGNPLTGSDGVAPATILKDLSHIKAVIVHAEFVWGEPLENVLIEFDKAMIGLQKSRIVTRSKQRDRIPTAEELQILTNFFYKKWKRVKNSTPMHLIIWFAIYTARREDELCSLRLDDYDDLNSQWLIRDAKNPNGSIGNHKYAHMEPRAINMIDEFMNPEVRERMAALGYDKNILIPVNAATVSAYFTRACSACGISDLRFHDLRHEAATRYAEDGFTIPQLQTITLHESWNTLKRYVNLKKRGLRLEFEDAVRIAEDNYNSYYKDWSKKQRYMALVDKNDAFEDDGVINVSFDFIKKHLDVFIEIHQNNKYFKRLHVNQMNSNNPFAWNNSNKSFVAQDIQLAWEDWFIENGKVDWKELPEGSTHFAVKDLTVVKKLKTRTYLWDDSIQGWMDSFGQYLLDEKKHVGV